MPHQNPPEEALREFLTHARSIAVVGASSNPERASHGIFGKLLRAGYRVIPVNPQESSVLGQPAVASLEEVTGEIDIVNVFRRAELTPEIADAAVAARAKVLWLQSGIWNEEAATRAQAGGLTVVMDDCIGVALSRLHVPNKTPI